VAVSVSKNPKGWMRLVILAVACCAAANAADKGGKNRTDDAGAADGKAVMWRDPEDFATRDLFYGSGGKEHEPHGPFTFEKEDMNGSNPKFDVKDADGTKWKVKLGAETRPETVASRLVWATGYFTTEDYFVPEIQVSGMPAHLHRGQRQEGPGGTFHNVRMKRDPDGEKKLGDWKWADNPFKNTRDWNGLRTLMAVINNWDLADDNNAVFKHGKERIYMVGDLGASFGTASFVLPLTRAKGNVHSYSHARFIRKTTADTVDFQDPGMPSLIFLFYPPQFFPRIHMEWIGHKVPRTDAKWLGQMLGRLSNVQIRDAFRSAGYSPDQIDAFTRVVENRIAALNDL
jgi:hypothetical protein